MTIPRALRKRSQEHHKSATVLKVLDVWPVGQGGRRGILRAGPFLLPCSLGRSGPVLTKREGDGGTPMGMFAIRRVHLRADRTGLRHRGRLFRVIAPDDGWCDAGRHPAYNRRVTLPFSASHEVLWREDALYDAIFELGYNDDPPLAGRGSAIFLHVARPGFTPTEGCVAVERRRLLMLLSWLTPETVVRISRSPIALQRISII